jgi:hypothetical protein
MATANEEVFGEYRLAYPIMSTTWEGCEFGASFEHHTAMALKKLDAFRSKHGGAGRYRLSQCGSAVVIQGT